MAARNQRSLDSFQAKKSTPEDRLPTLLSRESTDKTIWLDTVGAGKYNSTELVSTDLKEIDFSDAARISFPN
jgi:hypothetical protein